jgi:hypothetical protein
MVLILDQFVFLVGRCTEVCLPSAGFWAGAETVCADALSDLAPAPWFAEAPVKRAATHTAAAINPLVFMAAYTLFVV